MAKKKKKKNSVASAIKKAAKAVNKVVKKTSSTASRGGYSSSRSSAKSLARQGTSTVKKAAVKTNSAVKKSVAKKKVAIPTIKQTQQKKTQFQQFKKDAKTGRFGKTVQTNTSPKKKEKKKQETYKTGNNTVAALAKGAATTQIVAESAKAYRKTINEYKKAGYELSENEKKNLRNVINAEAKATERDIHNDIQKKYGERIEKVEQLSKKEREAYHRARIFSSTRGRKIKGSTQSSEKEFLKENPEIAKKLAKIQTADYVNRAGLVGVIEGLSPTSIANKNVSKYYSDRDAAAVDKAKDSTAYKAGYTAGTIGSFFIGGGGGAAEKGIQTAFKGAMKVGAKKTAKSIGKAVTKKELKTLVKKNLKGSVKTAVEKELKSKGKSEILDKIVDNTWRSLKLTGKDKAKTLVANRAADAIISTPFNVADAVKQGTDARGNFDPTEAAKAFATSTVMDMTVGGAVDAASILTKGGNYKKLTGIIAKRNLGQSLTDSEIKWYNDIMEKVRTENAAKRQTKAVSKAAADYKGTGVDVTKITDANAATAKAVDSTKATGYNLGTGGVANDNGQTGQRSLSDESTGEDIRQMGQRTVPADTGGTANIRQVDAGSSAGSGVYRSNAVGTTGTEGLGRNRVGGNSVEPETRTKMTNSGIVDTKLSSSDYAVFSRQLDNAISTNKHGAFVDSQSVDSLKSSEAKTFLSDDGSAGVAVKSDGDIVGVFNAGTKYRGAVKDLIVTARANGGTKMDCYGKALVKKYEQAGFVPVARVPFNAEYVDDALLLKNKPDVYIMMKNNDDIDTVITKMGKDEYAISSSADLDVLPIFNDYDEALAYRDGLLAKQEKSLRYQASSQALPDDSYLSADRLSANSINNTDVDVNIVRRAEELKAQGLSEDEVLETLTSEGVNPIDALRAVGDDIDEDFIAEARRVGNEPETTTQFDNIAEKTKYDNPSPRQALERATERISPEEVPRARQTAVKLANQVDDDVAEIIEPWVREGLFDKATKQAQDAALKQAREELEDGSAYQKFMDMDFDGNEHLFMARAQVLFEKLSKDAVNDNDATRALLEVIDKATDASSHAGRLLNATKMLLRTTPEGRLRVASKEALKLQEKYADRLGGKAITLSDEQVQRILKAETDEEIEEVMGQISVELWDNIPATWFEKWNEIRHFSMLANPKTHIRNIIGNSVFKVGRTMSDAIEIGLYKIPAVRKRIENLGSSIEMVHVTRNEIKNNSEYLDGLFEKNYKKANSKQKYIETTRPDGSPIVRTKWLNNIIQKNYAALEWEDVALTLKHEYQKNYVRWAKSKDIPLDKLDEMTPQQKTMADAYAMRRAEIATFRDNSKMADVLVRFKEKTAGKAGDGSWLYRAGNMVLESQMPFVKTPVNILRRSIDYSPISLLRAMNNLRKVSDVEALKTGIHQLSTGLTGTGVFMLGATLAANDFITVNVGDVSGDEYYDRDMGYQDFSIKFRVGDHEYSATIDWLSPMQVSLFMGANAFDMLQKDGLTTRDIFDGLLNIVDPMMDMSFMSSAKDTMDTFMETAFRGEDASYADAIMNTLFGSVPQGYLNSFVPQIFSQTAGMLDNKMRDTRSTAEDPLARSWESWFRKMANRVPVLRQKVLNPKIDRFGSDVKTGSNPVIKFLNSFLNPSNVKEIHFTKMDKEIIDIYNHMPEGDDKKFYYYNFTGNPSYELADGDRMTYDELYKYGKKSRQDQAASIDIMIKSNSYKNMTYTMKADEVNSAHWNAEMVADNKTYGSKYLLDKMLKEDFSSDVDAIKLARSTGAVSDKAMANYIINKEKFLARCHETDYYTKAMSIALYGDDNIMKVFDINADKVKYAREYVTKYGDKAYKMFTNASCNVISGIDKAGATVSTNNKAISAADFKINEDTYKAMGISADKANMGVGLKNFGYSYAALETMKMNAKYGFDADGSGTLKKSEIMAYIDSLGLDSNEEKAVLFAYFSNAKNPYGGVPNYLGFEDVSSGGSNGSYSRYGYSRKGRSGSSSSNSKETSNNVPSWEEWVRDYITTGDDLKRVKFDKWDSPIDSAYIKKIQSILKDKPEAKSS